jgi:hypothetical protein
VFTGIPGVRKPAVLPLTLLRDHSRNNWPRRLHSERAQTP